MSRSICRGGASCGPAPKFGFLRETACAPIEDRRRLQTFVNITRFDCTSNELQPLVGFSAGVNSRNMVNRSAFGVLWPVSTAERRFEVVNQIAGVLYPDREAQQVGRGRAVGAFNRRAVLDQTLDTAE